MRLLSTPSLSAGATVGQALSVDVDTFGLNIPLGQYYIAYRIDDLNDISEGNENDNEYVFTASNQRVQVSNRNIVLAGRSKSFGNKNMQSVVYTVDINGNQSFQNSQSSDHFRFVAGIS